MKERRGRRSELSLLNFWLLCLCLVAVHAGSVPTDNSSEKLVCDSPYHPVGDVCLFIDNRISGDWNQMRSLCMEMAGDLAFFEDANLLHDVFVYVNDNGLNDASFWVGADDLLEEGSWHWTMSNADVRMNTPLWGPHYLSQEPTGGTRENCAMLNMEQHYFMYDDDCDALHGVICAPRKSLSRKVLRDFPVSGELSQKHEKEDNNELAETKDKALAECPVPFELIGDACYMIDSISTNTWQQGKRLCEDLGGSIAKIDDANILGYLFDVFANKSVTADLWISGSDEATEGEWVWLDSTPVKMGTPFWGESLFGSQEPRGGAQENCLCLRAGNYFFFHDEECETNAGVLCQYL